ncbi:hypothetical protein BC937DRAFT_94448 [Endogone sp. FLAS-F59071]|nr:hypothetical protein BC937DRAFT_94448 [Endogone sp. FLAS-F59071]|eukprot:RUS20764.1 hypothetical protein BC937DRAFT_94448 [Endogone sp. FLAS-F59071]
MLPLVRGGIAAATTFALTLLCIVLVASHPSNTQGTTIMMKRDIYVLPSIPTTPGIVTSIHSSQGSAIIYISGIIASFANIIATIFIFWRSYSTKRQNDDQKLTPSQRFPVYMAILDCLTAICIMANLFYPFMYDHLPPHAVCVGFGFITALLIGINMTLVGFIAFITWLKVCRQRSLALGNLDWKLWTFATVLPLVVGVTTAGQNGCFATDYTPGGKFEFVFTVAFNYIGLAITSFCYLSVISRLHTTDNDLAFSMSIAALKGSQNIPPSPPMTASLPEYTDVILNSSLSISAQESTFSSSSPEPLTPPPAIHQRQHTYPPPSPISIIIPPPFSHSLNSRPTSSLYSSKNDVGKLVPPESFGTSFGTSSAPLTPISIANPQQRVPVYANTAEKRTDVSLKGATKNMSHYIFVHLIQYTPIVIYCIALLTGNQTWWVYFLTVTFLNIGGVAKAYTYIHNEGFRDKVRLARELQKSDEDDFQYEKSNVVYYTDPTNTNATNSPALFSLHQNKPLVSCQPNPTATVWSTASDDEISVISLPIPPSRRRHQQTAEGSQPSSPEFSGVKSPVDIDHSNFPMLTDYPNRSSPSRPHSAFSPSVQDISTPVGVAASAMDVPNPFRNSIVSTLEAIASASSSHDSFVAVPSFSTAVQKKYLVRTSNPFAEKKQQKMLGPPSRQLGGSRRTMGSGSLMSKANGLAGSHTVKEEDENEAPYDVDYYGIEDYETEDNEVGVIMCRGGQGTYDEDKDDLSDESDTSTIDDNVIRYKAKKVSVMNFLKDNDL